MTNFLLTNGIMYNLIARNDVFDVVNTLGLIFGSTYLDKMKNC